MSKTISSRQTPRRIICSSAIATGILLITLGVAVSNTLFKRLKWVDSGIDQFELTSTGGRRTEVEIVTLRPDGFEPSFITRSSGLFLLAVDNRAEVENVRLRLKPFNTDTALVDITAPKERLNLDQFIDLPPGNYVLTEAAHPDWVCRITITAR